MLSAGLPSQSMAVSGLVRPRTLLMKPCDVYWSCQMNPTIASDRTTGMKNALW